MASFSEISKQESVGISKKLEAEVKVHTQAGFRVSKSDAPIFIVSCSQRTGSTLLMRLLNEHPDIMLWGEHGGCLQDLMACHETLCRWRINNPEKSSNSLALSNDFFLPNGMPPDDLRDSVFREFLRGMFPVISDRRADCRWGFKEVRYGAPIARFIQKLYPEARFIHLVRNLEDCITSMRKLEESGLWQRNWTDDSISSWIRNNKSFLEQRLHIHNYFLLRYEDITSANSSVWVKALERFLGLQEHSLNKSILLNHVDFMPRPVGLISLSEEERSLLNDPDVAQLLSDYGY